MLLLLISFIKGLLFLIVFITINYLYLNLFIPSGSSDYSRAYILPTHDASPTTIINILPSPESTLVPLINMGDGTSCLPAVFCMNIFI